MPKIINIQAREILDSRGNPTVEAVCTLEGGFAGLASVPSGASTGQHEAVELRDNDGNRWGGLGVLQAVENIKGEIKNIITGKDFTQSSLDVLLIKLDGTDNKSRLGANAILGVSLSFARASARAEGLELYEYLGELSGKNIYKLPQPMFNVINGGKHADSGLDIQEFMIAPVGFDSFHEKVEAASSVIHSLKKILEADGYATSVGDEGGFAPKLSSNEEALEILVRAITEAGFSHQEIKIGLDAAASEFFENGKYSLRVKGEKKEMTNSDMLAWYESLIGKYPIISIEDGFAEDDWEGFIKMNQKLGGKIKIVGDDLTVTNVGRIKMAIEKKAINSVLIKPNQIGTLSETIQAIELTKREGWTPFISHRSGETTDTFIADLAVGLSCEYIKAGSLSREERICKYNRLMEIEEMIAKKA